MKIPGSAGKFKGKRCRSRRLRCRRFVYGEISRVSREARLVPNHRDSGRPEAAPMPFTIFAPLARNLSHWHSGDDAEGNQLIKYSQKLGIDTGGIRVTKSYRRQRRCALPARCTRNVSRSCGSTRGSHIKTNSENSSSETEIAASTAAHTGLITIRHILPDLASGVPAMASRQRRFAFRNESVQRNDSGDSQRTGSRSCSWNHDRE